MEVSFAILISSVGACGVYLLQKTLLKSIFESSSGVEAIILANNQFSDTDKDRLSKLSSLSKFQSFENVYLEKCSFQKYEIVRLIFAEKTNEKK